MCEQALLREVVITLLALSAGWDCEAWHDRPTAVLKMNIGLDILIDYSSGLLDIMFAEACSKY
jgi:hypothetical protein